mmetsp:Transcript_12647/g.28952  ORF Transcript_12647/g.28952 Transcript_12647/m.28952 type:complete len:85 (-) Transcript_12647:584-838(-)
MFFSGARQSKGFNRGETGADKLRGVFGALAELSPKASPSPPPNAEGDAACGRAPAATAGPPRCSKGDPSREQDPNNGCWSKGHS